MADPTQGNEDTTGQRPFDSRQAQDFATSTADGPRPVRSATALILDDAALHGAGPERGDWDTRAVWDGFEAGAAAEQIYAQIREICADGTQLAEERQALASGLLHAFHLQAERLGRAADRLHPEMRDLARAQDGTEITAHQLEDVTHRHSNLDDRSRAFEELRDVLADSYRTDFGERWRPRGRGYAHSSPSPRSRTVTSRQLRRSRGYLAGQRSRPGPLAEQARAYGIPDMALRPPAGAAPAADGPALYRQWRTEWQALFDCARGAGVLPAETSGYGALVSRAEDLAGRPDLPRRHRVALTAFLANVGPAAPDRAPRAAEPDSGVPEIGRPAAAADAVAVWDPVRAREAVLAIVGLIDEYVAPDGTQLADEKEPLLWSLTESFNRQCESLRRELAANEAAVRPDAARPAVSAIDLKARLDAFEDLKAQMAAHYLDIAGREWQPAARKRHPTERLTQAAMEAEMAISAREDRMAAAHNVEGTFVAVSGTRDFTDIDRVYETLNALKAEHPDLVLIHGDGPGAVKIARTWAGNAGVDEVIVKPDWAKHGRKAAPVRRNDEILRDHRPKMLVSFAAPGTTEHMAMRARQLDVPVKIVEDPALAPAPVAPAPGGAGSARPDLPEGQQMYREFCEGWKAMRQEALRIGVHPFYQDGYPDMLKEAKSLLVRTELPENARTNLDEFIQGDAKYSVRRAALDALDEEMRSHIAARTAMAAQAGRRTLHVSEHPDYGAWAPKARELAADAGRMLEDTEAYGVHLVSQPELETRIADARKSLEELPALDTRVQPVQALYNELVAMRERMEEHTRQTGLHMFYQYAYPGMVKAVEALAGRDDVTDNMRVQFDRFRESHAEYTACRDGVERLDADLGAHIDAHRPILAQALAQRIDVADHPQYAAWRARTDELTAQAAKTLADKARFGVHLDAQRDRKARIEAHRETLESIPALDLQFSKSQALRAETPPKPGPETVVRIEPVSPPAPAAETGIGL